MGDPAGPWCRFPARVEVLTAGRENTSCSVATYRYERAPRSSPLEWIALSATSAPVPGSQTTEQPGSRERSVPQASGATAGHQRWAPLPGQCLCMTSHLFLLVTVNLRRHTSFHRLLCLLLMASPGSCRTGRSLDRFVKVKGPQRELWRVRRGWKKLGVPVRRGHSSTARGSSCPLRAPPLQTSAAYP